MTDIFYDAPPTVSRFMASTAFFRLLAGPVGGGKTTGVLFEMLRRSIEQAPGKDGVRRTRWAIVRSTLAQLKMTILLDIIRWFRPIMMYKVSESLVTLSFNDVVSEWYMLPLEDEDDQKRLLSMQLTGAFISEAIEIDPDLISALAGRCGRFPSEVPPTWFGIIADTNMPVLGSPWHLLMDEKTPPDWKVFIQPGGMEPNAENLAYLPQTPETMLLPVDDPRRLAQGRKYYSNRVNDPNQAWVQRYIHAQYGEDPSGTAVFKATFRRNWHVSQTQLEPVHNMPLLIGQDGGRAPCSLICQMNARGQLLVLAEVTAEDISLEPHIVTSLKPALFNDRFIGRMVAAVVDPSMGSKNNHYEETSIDLMFRLGIPAFKAPTNDIDARLRAVDELLIGTRMGPTGPEPAILIDGPNCPMLVRAMNGAYKYAKTKAGHPKPLPDKDARPFADLADCLQYVCLVVNSGLTQFITRRIMRRPAAAQTRVSAGGWT